MDPFDHIKRQNNLINQLINPPILEHIRLANLAAESVRIPSAVQELVTINSASVVDQLGGTLKLMVSGIDAAGQAHRDWMELKASSLAIGQLANSISWAKQVESLSIANVMVHNNLGLSAISPGLMNLVEASSRLGEGLSNSQLFDITGYKPTIIPAIESTLIRSIDAFTPRSAREYADAAYDVAETSSIELPDELNKVYKVKNIISIDELKAFCYKITISIIVVGTSMGFETDEILGMVKTMWGSLEDLLGPIPDLLGIYSFIEGMRKKGNRN